MRILVTGASSFLGHHVMPRLSLYHLASPHPNDFEIIAPSSKELNLLDAQAVIDYVSKHKPNVILHMAARCGGIGANKAAPAEFAHDNLKMTVNLFDAIRHVNGWINNCASGAKCGGIKPPVVTHFYGLGTVCAYPKHCPVPFKEDDLWNGYPEETNAPYGNSKRMMLVMQQSFREQFGLKGAHFIPVNMYGPHDHFDLENSHVIPALIRKFVSAKVSKTKFVDVWGDGTATREFLYVEDCAEAIADAVSNQFDYDKPINLGTGNDISIKDLADLINDIVGAKADVRFSGDVSVNGQPKRQLDVSRASSVLGFVAKTNLKEGLKETYEWYVEQNNISKVADEIINSTKDLKDPNRVIFVKATKLNDELKDYSHVDLNRYINGVVDWGSGESETQVSKRDLSFYEQKDKESRKKAYDALNGVSKGIFRNAHEKSDHLLDNYEDSFNDALSKYYKKYSSDPEASASLSHNNRGKRFSGNLTNKNSVSDTEIMASLLVSDEIVPPVTKLDDAWIAYPKVKDPKDEELNKDEEKNKKKVEERVEETVISGISKLVFDKARDFTSKLLIKAAYKLMK